MRNNRKKFLSEKLFEEIKSFLQLKRSISRKDFCQTFTFFKCNTLKNQDHLGTGIGVSAYNGKSALYTPQRILAYIERNFEIVSEDDIDAGEFPSDREQIK